MCSAGAKARRRLAGSVGAIVLAVGSVGFCAEPTTEPSEPLDPAIDLILTRIERARADLPAVSYFLRAQQERQDADKKYVYETTLSMVRDNQNRHCERGHTITINGRKYSTKNTRLLLTPKLFTLMNLDEPVIKEWEFTQAPPDVTHQVLILCHPDITKWGFGDGHGGLRDSILVTHIKNRYAMRAARAGDESRIELDLMRVEKDREWVVASYTIDPAQGYLITHGKVFSERGELVEGFDVTCTEIDHGIWFPTKVEDWSKGVKPQRTNIEITNLKLVQPNDELFQLSAIKPSDGARVVRIRGDGSREMFVVRDGKSYPEEVIERLKK